MADPMSPTLLAYTAAAVWAVLVILATAGAVLVVVEAAVRLRRFHRAGLARLRGQR